MFKTRFRLKNQKLMIILMIVILLRYPKNSFCILVLIFLTKSLFIFQFNNRVLCRIACDMLRLQCDHATYLLDNHPEIPKKIIEGLCTTLISHYIMVKQQNLIKEYKNVSLFIF